MLLPPSAVDAIVERVVELVLDRIEAVRDSRSPWLSGAQAAADYLGWPRERIYKRLDVLPHFKDDGRLMFRRDELDHYVEEQRER